MTFAVLLNTVVLSINHYGIKPELDELLDFYNKIFTYIFIIEMALKLGAMGIVKYVMDVMNLLDGLVVVISIFEIIYVAINSG